MTTQNAIRPIDQARFVHFDTDTGTGPRQRPLPLYGLFSLGYRPWVKKPSPPRLDQLTVRLRSPLVRVQMIHIAVGAALGLLVLAILLAASLKNADSSERAMFERAASMLLTETHGPRIASLARMGLLSLFFATVTTLSLTPIFLVRPSGVTTLLRRLGTISTLPLLVLPFLASHPLALLILAASPFLTLVSFGLALQAEPGVPRPLRVLTLLTVLALIAYFGMATRSLTGSGMNPSTLYPLENLLTLLHCAWLLLLSAEVRRRVTAVILRRISAQKSESTTAPTSREPH